MTDLTFITNEPGQTLKERFRTFSKNCNFNYFLKKGNLIKYFFLDKKKSKISLILLLSRT